MMKWMLAAGAAALAISSPVLADKGGHGGGQQVQGDRGGGQKQAGGNRGGGDRQVRANRGGGDRQVRMSGGGGNREFRAQRGGGDRQVRQVRQVRMNRGGGGDRQVRSARVDRGGDRARQMRFVQNDSRGRNRNEFRVARNDNRGRGNDRVRIESRGNDKSRIARFEDNRGRGRNNAEIVQFDRKGDRDVIRLRDRDRNRFADLSGDRVFKVRDFDNGRVRVRDVDRDDLFFRRLGYGVGGCPPGLAKKGNGCMPPGQAARFIGQPLIAATRFGALEPLPRSFNSLFWDNDDYYYRYGGGYLYRVDRDRDLIDGLFPLFGAALVGQPLNPYYVNSYYNPPYYSAFYPNSPYDCYRYGYAYVYETDCATGFVEDVIPTYAYGYGVGQIMPASYSYYNVPYAYRSYFADNNDYYYRYAPGAIYRVDRDTALISAVAALLTGGLSVGQPLPVGYSAYNVPLAYRATYFDSPDVWYRYDNGYIYGINPRTRVVSNVAYVIV